MVANRALFQKSAALFLILALLMSTFIFKANAAPAPWAPNTAYAVGDLVTYNASTYKCIQAHTSLTGWEPPNTPALWGLQNSGTGGTSTTAPSTPTGLQATNVTSTSVSLSWTASTGAAGYTVFRNGTQIGTSTSTTFTDNGATNSGLAANTTYSYTVNAYDAAGNASAQSSAISVTTSASSAINAWAAGTSYKVGDIVSYGGSTYTCIQSHTSQTGWEPPNVPALWGLQSGPGSTDTQPPTVPAGLTVTGSASSSISISWTASTDNVGVTGYTVYRNGTNVGTTSSTSYTDSGLAANTSYMYTVSAYDAAGNNSGQSASATGRTQPTTGDTQPPTVPTGLRATSVTTTSVGLTWTASTDNVGVAGYTVYRNGTQIATTTSTNYTDTGLTANTAYSYTVSAYDAAQNNSAQSSAVNVTTLSQPTPPPSTNYKMVGYYPAWATYARNFQVADLDPTKVNVINYAFANISGGKIVVGDTYADTDKFFPGDCWDAGCKRGNFNELAKLKAAHPNIKSIISVGGWTWSGNFSSAAATDSSRTAFASSAVDFVRTWGFDGVDLDWEYPVSGGLQSGSPNDKTNFTLLLQAIRSALDAAGSTDGKHYYLTIAAGAGPSYVQNTELGNIQGIVDWINLMSYDYHGGWETLSNNNAPLYFDPNDKSANASSYYVDASVTSFMNAGVPASKLVMGLPYYGRGWGGCPSANNGLYQTCSGASSQGTWEAGIFDFSDLQANYINKNGYTRYWNSSADVPYLYNPSNGVYISYDDAQSIGLKDTYVKSKGLAGVMFWDLSSDRNRTLETQIVSDLGNP